MSVKAIEMVRKIRDKQYEETKDLPLEAQIQYVKKKSGKLLQEFKNHWRSTPDNSRVPTQG